MEFIEKIKKLTIDYAPCIVVCHRYIYDNHGGRCSDGFTILGESSEHLGHSRGKGTKYDYGFMGLDTEAGINVMILVK